MRTTICLLFLSATLPAVAAFEPTPTASPTPTARPTPTADARVQATGSSDNGSFTNSDLSSLTNFAALSNLFGNLQASNVSPALSNLQASLAEALPALTALINGNQPGGGGGNVANQAGISSAASIVANSVVNPSVTNQSAGAGVIGAGSSPTVPGPQTSFLPATGVANPGAVNNINNLAAQPGAAGSAQTAGFTTGNLDAQTLQQLVNLQNSLQAALPLLQALSTASALGTNGGTFGLSNGFGANGGASGFTNTTVPSLQQKPMPSMSTQSRAVGTPQGKPGR